MTAILLLFIFTVMLLILHLCTTYNELNHFTVDEYIMNVVINIFTIYI